MADLPESWSWDDVIPQLREALSYDPVSGSCLWRSRPASHFKDLRAMKIWNTRYAGKVAGTSKRRPKGKLYSVITMFNRHLYLHRAIIAMETGRFPDEVDHIDGNGLNNRRANLRPSDRKDNAKNTRRQLGRSLPTGIVFRYGKFEARITTGGSVYYLGRFGRLEDATRARSAANERFGFHSNHGQVRPSYA